MGFFGKISTGLRARLAWRTEGIAHIKVGQPGWEWALVGMGSGGSGIWWEWALRGNGIWWEWDLVGTGSGWEWALCGDGICWECDQALVGMGCGWEGTLEGDSPVGYTPGSWGLSSTGS